MTGILCQINPIHVHTSYLPSVLILPFTCSRSFKAVSYPHVSYQIMYTLLFFTIPATCPAHLIHLHFITPKLLNQYKSWSPSLCNSPVSHYFLPLLPSLSTLFSNTLNQCSSLNVIVQRYLSIITTIWSSCTNINSDISCLFYRILHHAEGYHKPTTVLHR